MSLSPIRTLVIGGGGYIGQHLLPILIKNGRQVTVLGRHISSKINLPLGATYIQGDFSQKNLISNLLENTHEVIHLAYASVPNTSFNNPLADLIDNLPAAVHLFSEVARLGKTLLLVSSGGTVYGDAISLPISESHPNKPISPYGVTKLTIEKYAHLFAKIYGLKYICVRPSNAYGPGQRPFSGQGFIATAIGSILKGVPVNIFGKQGTIRDYIYIDDLAKGIFCALDDGELGEIYNIGSGVGVTNSDILQILTPIMNQMGLDVLVENQQDRAFDVQVNILDSSKLISKTGWGIRVDLEAGLRLTVNSMLT